MGDFEPTGLKWAPVKQNLNNAREIADIGGATSRQIAYSAAAKEIIPGNTVAIALGSRGIDRIDQVAKAVVESVYHMGATPYIVPAMGSHEGATAKGQKKALASLGITERSMGCKIDARMDVELLGKTQHGVDVFFSAAALRADHVVAVSRVKKHTSFTAHVESGLTKLTTVGLGKEEGADAYHHPAYANRRPSYEHFSRDLEEGLRVIRRKVSIPFGVALVENGLNRLAYGSIVPGTEIPLRDREMLLVANDLMARLPGDQIDILIVGEIGKSISGRGMDTNVINRDYDRPLPQKPAVGQIIVQDVIGGGNANGIGAADIVLEPGFKKIDWKKTHKNAETAGTPQGADVRMVASNDIIALEAALERLHLSPKDAKIMYIKNTKALAEVWVTENMIPQMTGANLQVGEAFPMSFDSNRMLTLPDYSI